MPIPKDFAGRCRCRSDPADCGSGDKRLAGEGRAAYVRLPLFILVAHAMAISFLYA